MKKILRRVAPTPSRSQTRRSEAQAKLPFIEHLYELRKRLVYIAVSVAVFSLFTYSIERSIITLLLKPAGSQHFIYTSPIGGLDFLFRVCLYIGIAMSIPVIVYQFLRYLEPLLKESSMRFIVTGSLVSGFLALAGIIFGYSIGLPATLHFLLHQFVSKQVQPLITIQSYMAFVTVYMLGSALLFQVPLILLFINRIKPLSPKRLISFRYQRWVILGAFVGGGIMNPNPNLLDQVVIVGPLIIMYQVGVLIIWFEHRKRRKPAYLTELLEHDSELQLIRSRRFAAACSTWEQQTHRSPTQSVTQQKLTDQLGQEITEGTRNNVSPPSANPGQRPARPVVRRYISDFGPARSYRSLDRRPSSDPA